MKRDSGLRTHHNMRLYCHLNLFKRKIILYVMYRLVETRKQFNPCLVWESLEINFIHEGVLCMCIYLYMV
jgi:hypothetical protein